MLNQYHRFMSGTRYVVPALFLLLILIQVLDIHSTLSASAGHYEANKVIHWLSEQVGFTVAVCIVKACSSLVLLFLYRVWRLSNGFHDCEFSISLGLIFIVYGVVVTNNYLS